MMKKIRVVKIDKEDNNEEPREKRVLKQLDFLSN